MIDYITTESPVHSGSITLIPVVNIQLDSQATKTDSWISAHKVPLAVVVCSHTGIQAVDITASKISIDDLRNMVPKLDSVIAQACQYNVE